MRSRWLALLALVAALSLVAVSCGDDDGDEGGTNGSGTAQTVPTLEDGKLIIGSDIPYPPFEFNDDAGQPTGFDVELMNAIAAQLGLEPVWVNANFDTIFTALDGNRFDVVASAVTAYAEEGSPAYKVTQKRATIVSFSEAYYDSLQSLTVNAAKTPDLASVDQLQAGDRVGVQRGTTGAFWAEENLQVRGVEIVSFVKVPDMYNALEAGQLIGAVNDLPVSLDAIESKPDLEVVQQIATGEEYAFAVNQDNPQLLDAVNGAFDKLIADGTYLDLFTKYFPDQEPPAYAS
jgi:polar amino acid transport system substrate-binding protein